jgi:hypothetical protein
MFSSWHKRLQMMQDDEERKKRLPPRNSWVREFASLSAH